MADASILAGRCVAVYVGGSVAAYKAAAVVTLLRGAGAEVRVSMTQGAQHFITPTTLRALSGNPVSTSVWDAAGAADGMGHLAVSAWAEVQVAVAASTNLLARLAGGVADDAVTAAALACRAPLLVAPAMETAMWTHPATVANVSTLRGRGVVVVGPVSGRLASGHDGSGRMVEPEAIVAAVADALGSGSLRGRHVIVTAGGTREAIDPVRYLSNRSSGKMGNALALEALRRGARVTVITAAAPPAPRCGLHIVGVESAAQLHDAVLGVLDDQADLLLMAAAVADHRPAAVADHKLKKDEREVRLELVPTVDILCALREHPRRRGVVVVGFAAETDDLLDNARAKLQAKELDFIVANHVGPGIGMGTDDNAVTVLDAAGVVAEVERAPKAEVASRILDAVAPGDRLSG